MNSTLQPPRLHATSGTIGLSEQSRPISLTRIGPETAPLRVLVTAGQHGDERLACQAVWRFAQELQQRDALPKDIQLAILYSVNPDGAAAGIRSNASGRDLNRDHQLLASAETQALHRFVRLWHPQLVVDTHTYPPRRKHLLQQKLAYCHDVFIDVPTNPAIAHPLLKQGASRTLRPLFRGLRSQGFRCGRYTLIRKSGRVRHSTADIVDARNGLALRTGAFTLLVEGRSPCRGENTRLADRTSSALVAALHTILGWADDRRDRLVSSPDQSAPGTLVSVGGRYQAAGHPCKMLFRNTRSGKIQRVVLPNKFTPHIKPTRHVTLPRAYAVPTSLVSLLTVLKRHGVATQDTKPGQVQRIERYQVSDVRPSRRAGRAPHTVTFTIQSEQRCIDDYVVLPVTADSGRVLAVFLEPHSKYGLFRHESMQLPLTPGQDYPVIRIV